MLRPTTPLESVEPAEETEGRGESSPASEGRTPKPRRKRAPVGGETKGRKLSLPDSVYDRLQLLAIQRRSTASAIVAEILDRNLPHLRIERDA